MPEHSSVSYCGYFAICHRDRRSVETALDELMLRYGFAHRKASDRGRTSSYCYIDLSGAGIRSCKLAILWLPQPPSVFGPNGAGTDAQGTILRWMLAVAFERPDVEVHERAMVERFETDPAGMREALTQYAPALVAEKLCYRHAAESDVAQARQEVRRRLHDARSFSLRRMMLSFRRRRRPGAYISFHGPDGCGKTTIIQGFLKLHERHVALGEEGHAIHHLRCHVLPNARAMLQRDYDERNENYEDPHRGTPKGAIPSLMALAYYLVDYRAGHFLTTRREMRSNKIVVFDRYSFDILADPKRIKVGLPYWIRNAFVLATPRPEVSFYLDGPPELIYQRKQELTIEAIRDQVALYRRIAGTFKRFVILDVREKPDCIAEKAFRSFVERVFLDLRTSECRRRSAT